MALTIEQYSDFDISFRAHPITKDLVKKTGANAVVQSVLNLIQTAHYEKPFHPEIGCNIRNLLFEQIDSLTANHLAEEIKIVINNFEPRARINGVYVESNDREDGYDVTIEFYILNLTNLISINTFLERIR